MATPETVNRYNGPLSGDAEKAGRIPVVAIRENRGWQGDLDDARGCAAAARRASDSKEKIAVAIMAIGKYSSAIEKMHSYNEKAADSGVTKEINIAKLEMAELQLQMGLTTD